MGWGGVWVVVVWVVVVWVVGCAVCGVVKWRSEVASNSLTMTH